MYIQLSRRLQKCKKKKKMILFIIFAQNIDCEHVIPGKTSFARQLAILKTK